jgi:hypothetical protein
MGFCGIVLLLVVVYLLYVFYCISLIPKKKYDDYKTNLKTLQYDVIDIESRSSIDGKFKLKQKVNPNSAKSLFYND